MIKIEHCKKLDTAETIIRTTVGEKMLTDYMPNQILLEVSRLVAERYVKENYQEIIKHIDQNAIATLSVAESAAKIRETLEKKIPLIIPKAGKTYAT